MKAKNFFLHILLLTAISGSAQDIIILQSGNEIQSKVIEVEQTILKYKKYENLSGPIYTLGKDSIFMIKYENGTKDFFGVVANVSSVKPDETVHQNPSNVKRKIKLITAGDAGFAAGIHDPAIGLANTFYLFLEPTRLMFYVNQSTTFTTTGTTAYTDNEDRIYLSSLDYEINYEHLEQASASKTKRLRNIGVLGIGLGLFKSRNVWLMAGIGSGRFAEYNLYNYYGEDLWVSPYMKDVSAMETQLGIMLTAGKKKNFILKNSVSWVGGLFPAYVLGLGWKF